MRRDERDFRMSTENDETMRPLRAFFPIIVCLVMMAFCLGMLAGTAHAAPSRKDNFASGYSLSGGDAQAIYQVAMRQKGLTNGTFKYPDAWCAFFVLDCARLAGIPESIVPYNDSDTGNCTALYNKMISRCGAQRVSSPQRGDFVFYYCNGTGKYVHVGIWDGNGMAVEGNVSGCVMHYKTANYRDTHGHTVSSGQITRVYVRPAYRSINACSVSLSFSSATYTGQALYPTVRVVSGRTTLREGIEYNLSYSSNVNAGTAKVTVTGRGVYGGSQTKSFRIEPKSISKVSLSVISSKCWTGSQICPAVKMQYNGKVLWGGYDFTVSYGTNRSLGKGSIKITGKGNYTGTRNVSFYIVPNAVSGVKLSSGLHKIKVSWKAPRGGASGYAVRMKKHSASSWKTYYVKGTSMTLTKLVPFVNYDIRIQPYVQVGSMKAMGPQTGTYSRRPY